jgi:hypothetical protein
MLKQVDWNHYSVNNKNNYHSKTELGHSKSLSLVIKILSYQYNQRNFITQGNNPNSRNFVKETCTSKCMTTYEKISRQKKCNASSEDEAARVHTTKGKKNSSTES